VWTTLELVLGESQSLKGVEVHEVEVIAPIQECFGEPGHPDQQVDYKGKPPWLREAIWVVRPIKSDWGFKPTQVLRDRCTHRIDCPPGELELLA
jgi:hypothetical protein